MNLEHARAYFRQEDLEYSRIRESALRVLEKAARERPKRQKPPQRVPFWRSAPGIARPEGRRS